MIGISVALHSSTTVFSWWLTTAVPDLFPINTASEPEPLNLLQ